MLTTSIATFMAMGLPREYTARAQLLPPQTNNATAQILAAQTGGTSNLGLSSMAAKNPSDLYAKLFTSLTVIDLAIDRLQLDKAFNIASRHRLRDHVRRHAEVGVSREGMITVSYTDKDPQRSADMVNQLIAGMYEVGAKVLRESSNRQLAFYDQLITETRGRLMKADDRLQALETNIGLTRMKGQEEASTGIVADLHNRIATLRVNISKMLRTATERHPEVQRATAELVALQAQLERAERPAGPSKTEHWIAPVDYPDKRRAVEPARREVAALSTVLEKLMDARETTRIDEARELSTIVVLDRADVPTLPSGPNRSRLILSGFAGGLLAALLWTYAVAVYRAIRKPAERRRMGPGQFFRWLVRVRD